MKLRFKIAFRVYLAALALVLGWSVWVAAAAPAAPRVQLAEPVDGARFGPGSDILLRADVAESPETVRVVEFLADGRAVGVAFAAPYSMTWSNVPAGAYDLSVRLVPSSGDTVDSQRVRIRVAAAGMTAPGWIRDLSVRWPFLRYPLWGNELWKYLFSLIYIFLAFYVSKLLDYLTRFWLKKWAQKTATTFDDLLLDLLNGPVKVVAFVIFLRIGLDVFEWPDLVQRILARGFAIIVAISLTYMVLKFIDLVMGYWRKRVQGEGDRGFDEQLFPMVRKSLKVFVIVVGVLVTLDNIGVNITAAIASLSIGGLAVGLAAQDTLANLFGAVSVFVDKPFRIGDRVQLDGVDGSVEAIGLRSTRVRNLDGYLVTIPNKTMGNATITNVTRRPSIKTVMNIGLTYDTPTDKVKRAAAILQEIYRGNPNTVNVIVSFNQFAESALNLMVVHWWNGPDPGAFLPEMHAMNLAIKERFDAEGIEFAFPSRTVYLKQDSK